MAAGAAERGGHLFVTSARGKEVFHYKWRKTGDRSRITLIGAGRNATIAGPHSRHTGDFHHGLVAMNGSSLRSPACLQVSDLWCVTVPCKTRFRDSPFISAFKTGFSTCDRSWFGLYYISKIATYLRILPRGNKMKMKIWNPYSTKVSYIPTLL